MKLFKLMVTSTKIIDFQKTFLVFVWLIKQSNREQFGNFAIAWFHYDIKLIYLKFEIVIYMYMYGFPHFIVHFPKVMLYIKQWFKWAW